MVLDAVQGASDGVKSLAIEAIKAGATKEEITEALRVAQNICSFRGRLIRGSVDQLKNGYLTPQFNNSLCAVSPLVPHCTT